MICTLHFNNHFSFSLNFTALKYYGHDFFLFVFFFCVFFIFISLNSNKRLCDEMGNLNESTNGNQNVDDDADDDEENKKTVKDVN